MATQTRPKVCIDRLLPAETHRFQSTIRRSGSVRAILVASKMWMNGSTLRVRFLGGRSDVPRLLAAADVFCQPNRESEGFSLAFMEACAAGLPLVTSALGGALEILSEDNGFPTAVGDVAAVAKALRILISEPEVRHRLGNAGRRRVEEQCDPARQLERYRELFVRLAAARRR